jgi:hypothetical protein
MGYNSISCKEALKEEYFKSDNPSLRELAKKYNVKVNTVRFWAHKEKWVKLNKDKMAVQDRPIEVLTLPTVITGLRLRAWAQLRSWLLQGDDTQRRDAVDRILQYSQSKPGQSGSTPSDAKDTVDLSGL